MCPDFLGHHPTRKHPHSPPRSQDRSRQSRGGRDRTRDLATDQKCPKKNPYRDGTPDKREDRRDDKACRATSASSPCPPRAAATCGRSSSVSTPCWYP